MPKSTKKTTKKNQKPSKARRWLREYNWLVFACLWLVAMLTTLIVGLVSSAKERTSCEAVGGSYVNGYCLDIKTLNF